MNIFMIEGIIKNGYDPHCPKCFRCLNSVQEVFNTLGHGPPFEIWYECFNCEIIMSGNAVVYGKSGETDTDCPACGGPLEHTGCPSCGRTSEQIQWITEHA